MSDREQGMKTRREVLGDAHVDRAIENTTAFTEPFQEFITRYAWGEIWSRPGLERRTRSAITLAALVALRAENEIAMHVRAARRNGMTPEEISEVISMQKLDLHEKEKPCVFFNVNGFYEPLREMLRRMAGEEFITQKDFERIFFIDRHETVSEFVVWRVQ
jgi:alkylhydroperoxidase/carboxymuconolactone decarboxylase family protein YurZ